LWRFVREAAGGVISTGLSCEDSVMRRLVREFEYDWGAFQETNGLEGETRDDTTPAWAGRIEIDGISSPYERTALWCSWLDILLEARSISLSRLGVSQNRLARCSVRLTKVQIRLEEEHAVSTVAPRWLSASGEGLLATLGLPHKHLERRT
jgi:hypothetical protein